VLRTGRPVTLRVVFGSGPSALPRPPSTWRPSHAVLDFSKIAGWLAEIARPVVAHRHAN
jgi:hypothetical protein